VLGLGISILRGIFVPSVVSTSTIPRDADRVAILANPKAGPRAAGLHVARLADRLRKHGFHVEQFTDLAAATTTANRWHAEGRLRVLVGAGGDGTAAELVNRTPPGLPLTLLPAGNANLLAGYFGLTKDPDLLCRTIADGLVAQIDAGRANGRIFLLMASCGFDAEVVNRIHEQRTGHISLGTYFRPIVEVARRYEYPEMRVQLLDDEAIENSPLSMGEWPGASGQWPVVSGQGTADWTAANSPSPAPNPQSPALSLRWMFAFNLPCYAGGLRIAPQADGSDGLLDVCGFRQGRFTSRLALVVLRRHQRSADWIARRGRRVRIASEARVPYQLDGDPGGWLPLEIETLPGRLTLVVPREAVEKSGGCCHNGG
jgi:diacylglycerol kinase (ATP)